jgi:hypothetical protein
MLKGYLSKLMALAAFIMLSNCAFAQFGTATVNSPAGIAGDYFGKLPTWGPQTFSVTGDIAYADDATGASPNDGCEAITNVTGKIALIDRGTCGFAIKAVFAQQGGATAIIICNNAVANPYLSLSMGGVPTEPITVPIMMLSYNDCQTIKAELGTGVNVTLTDGGPVAGVGEACSTAEVVGPGTYTCPEIIAGLGSTAPNGGHGRWYSYTPTTTNLVTVSSCGGGINTRLTVFADGCGTQTLIDQSVDECEISAGGAVTASDATFIAYAGTEYLILWDDASDYQSFQWSITEGALPNADVTFTVDMQFETVSPAGVFIAGTFTGPTPVAMTNNGDGTYSYTTSIQVASQVQWRYINGATNFENSAALADCGVPDAVLGGFNRVYTLENPAGAVLGTVCFNSCGGCIPTDCADPIELIQDNIDSYTLGEVGPQALHWSTWSGNQTGGENGTVSTVQAQTAPNSLQFLSGGSQDALLLLGDKTSGHYILQWNMYVAAGKGAYFNIQHLATPGAEFATELAFENNGIATLDAGGVDAAIFEYPQGAWFTVRHYFDLDNDWVSMYIGNQYVYGWQFSLLNDGMPGTNQLSSIDFYPRPAPATDEFYVDDVLYAAIPPVADGQYCHTALPITPGTHSFADLDCYGGVDQIDGISAAWFSYTPTEDGWISVSTCEIGGDTRAWILEGDCSSRTIVGVNDDECTISGGADLYASYREAVVKANTTYFIMFDNAWENAGYDFELIFNTSAPEAGNFCESAITVAPGNTYAITEFGNAAMTGPIIGTTSGAATPTGYAQSKWFKITPTEDISLRAYSCAPVATVDTRIWVYTGECGNFSSLTLAATNDDACGAQSDLTWDAEAGVTYYIEWDDIAAGTSEVESYSWALEDATIPTVSVKFSVDMSKEASVSAGGVRLVGNFNNWTDQIMTSVGNDIYEITLDLDINQTIQYKFKNGLNIFENNDDLEDCGVPDGFGAFNRESTIGESNTTLGTYCFNWCVSCDLVSANETAFSKALGISPNPASNFVNVNYNFEQTTNLNVRLVNSLGQVVLVRNLDNALSGSERFNVANLSSGTYTAVFSNGQETVAKRIVVE